jgi:FkbM family methyltransferase
MRFFKTKKAPQAPVWPGSYMGLQMPFDATVISPNVEKAVIGKWYEADEAVHLPHVLQEEERVLELGTGLGLISALAAKDPKVAKVLTVEANPNLTEYIHNFHRINKVEHKVEQLNAVAMPKPVSNSTSFYVRSDFWASSLSPQPWGYEKVIDVAVVDLNALIERFRPTMMIVDIEGGEIDLFEGSELGTVKKILMEVHQHVIGRSGMKKVFDALSARNFHYDQWHSSKNVVTFSAVDRS